MILNIWIYGLQMMYSLKNKGWLSNGCCSRKEIIMLNVYNILETIRMIQDECLDIRTTTMGISLLDCIDTDIDKACEKVYNKIVTKNRNDKRVSRIKHTALCRAVCFFAVRREKTIQRNQKTHLTKCKHAFEAVKSHI